jgi:hypothetical protein
MSVLDVASALFTGTIDEIAFQGLRAQRDPLRFSELIEKELTES